MPNYDDRRRPALRRVAFLLYMMVLGFGVWQLMVHPQTPLPTAWNPVKPLDVQDDYTPITDWKLSGALANDQMCLDALETGGLAQRLNDFEASAQCHIRPQVSVRQVGLAGIKPLNTRCQTALRMAMWERYGIQPAARRHYGQEVKEILHFSSYNCRAIRTASGGSGRMSTHATADAVDISGFVLADGRRVTLLQGWNGSPEDIAFFREVRDSACAWFRVTLGPDYNRLHADHFHLQHTGFGLCR
jgi:hypothetical protein